MSARRSRKQAKRQLDPKTAAAHKQAATPGCANPNSWARWNFDPAEEALTLRHATDIRDVKRRHETKPTA